MIFSTHCEKIQLKPLPLQLLPLLITLSSPLHMWAIHPVELSQTARAILCYFSCIITFLILPVLPEYYNFLVKHEYWNMNSAALNDWWPRNGDTYILFVSLNTLWITQKVYSDLIRGTAAGTWKLLVSNYLQVIVIWYWIYCLFSFKMPSL